MRLRRSGVRERACRPTVIVLNERALFVRGSSFEQGWKRPFIHFFPSSIFPYFLKIGKEAPEIMSDTYEETYAQSLNEPETYSGRRQRKMFTGTRSGIQCLMTRRSLSTAGLQVA